MQNIRQLNRGEMEASLKLSQFAFQYELSEKEYLERLNKMKPEQQWGYFIGDALAAKLSILPLNTWINGVQYRMGGIASVSTWPEYRRQGAVSKLLTYALEYMKEQGHVVSFLHPFAIPFYRKFGWELYVDYKVYELESRQLPHLFTIEGKIERTTSSSDAMKQLYDRYARGFNGTLARDEEWWQERVFLGKKMNAALYWNEEEQAEGYILYRVENFEMEIKELVFVNETARRSLWKFIANHDSMINKVKLKAPADDSLPFLLPDPRFKQELVPYFMARIVDVESFIEQFRFVPPPAPSVLTLTVEDRWAPWNDRRFTIEINREGRALLVDPGEPLASSVLQNPQPGLQITEDSIGLSCDIGALSAMMMGYSRPSALFASGRLKGGKETVDQLESLLPRQSTYLLDYF